MQLKNWIFNKSFLFLLAALFFHNVSFGQLKADFSSSITEGCTPLVVQFTDESTGTPTEWIWDLGNGSISTQQDPGAIYITPGSYTVKLKIKNANGEDSITKTNLITVYAKPTVDFTATPTTGCTPLNVTFTDKSNAGSGTIQNWIWDFGDGTSAIDQNPVHTYINPGSFNVSLFIINSFGCQQSIVKDSLISPADSVHAGFNYTYTNVCNPPATVNFTNTSSSSLPLSYSWDFGNGAQSTLTNPSNIYNKPGDFDVKLIATNTTGCSDTLVESISIGSVLADFALPDGVCINEPAVMSDSSSPVPISATWDFGDGQTGSGLVVNHTYNALGQYTVTYNADFGGCNSVVTKTVNVTDKPTSSFSSASVLTSCNAPLTVQFTNSSLNAASYIWDFGDGGSSQQASPQHTYTATGSYTVKLIAISPGGCSDTFSRVSYVRINQPKINGIVGLPYFNCAPASVPFKPTIVSPEAIATYAWNFGDGNTSNLATPTNVYSKEGTYKVTLTVTTISGCSSTYTLASAVVLSSKPQSNFSGTPINACASEDVVFADKSIGTITSWLWTFGDGATSTIQNPVHHYQDTGFFDVKLVVNNHGCKDTLEQKKYLYVAPPIANFNSIKDCSDPFQRTFNDLSIAPKSWNWDFGDGQTDNKKNTAHTYASPGSYNIRLIVTNGACADTMIASTQVIDENPVPKIKALNTNFCKYDSIQMTATNINPANLSGIKWVYGDGTSTGFSIKLDTVTHKYLNAGSYTIKLITDDLNGCYDTVLLPAPVTIFGPVASFTNGPGTCADSVFVFSDQSTSDGTFPLTKWVWDYGDGKTDTRLSPPFKHRYADSGTYDVKMTVFDSNGCYDTLFKKADVVIGKPYADFSITDPIRCTASSVNFKETSAGLSLSYSWNFGDGGTSTKAFPSHLYTTEGIYTVSLAVSDIYGCTDTITKIDSVSISNPIATFTISDSTATCPPLPVLVNNTSQNYSALSWTFGDGATSTLDQPFHQYTVPGIYSLQLIAHGYGSCADTAYHTINLKGPFGTFQYSPGNGCFPVTVSFNATATNTTTYIWDFGDGSTKITIPNNTTYTYTTPGNFVPKLILQDPSGCKVAIESPDTATISGVKPKFYFNPQTGCDSSLVTFADSSYIVSFDTLASIVWNFGDGSTSDSVNALHYYKLPGIYNVTQIVTSAAGCSGTYTLPVNVSVNNAPKLMMSTPDSACVNSNVAFAVSDTASIPETLQWLWDLGNSNQSSSPNFNYTYTTSGVYDISVTATVPSTGCADTALKSLTILGLPPVNAGNDTTICLNSFATLNPSGAATYNWNTDPTLSCTNCTNPLAGPSLTNTYYVTGSDNFGCQSSDSVIVNVIIPTEVSLAANNDTMCIGSAVQLSASGAEKYTWQPPVGLSSSTIANPVASPSASTTYTVIGEDLTGCFADTAFVSVFVAPLPTFNITDSLVTISSGSLYPIATTGSPDVIKWLWSPGLGLSCIDCAEPVAQPRANTTYTGTASTIFGCTATDIISFEVLCNNSNVFIPNTFSPNGDGSNERFFVQGKGLYNIKSMRIYNRWGVPVFEKWNFTANTQSEGWDGKYNSKPQPTDVYVYVIEVICDNGSVLSFKGNVTLIR